MPALPPSVGAARCTGSSAVPEPFGSTMPLNALRSSIYPISSDDCLSRSAFPPVDVEQLKSSSPSLVGSEDGRRRAPNVLGGGAPVANRDAHHRPTVPNRAGEPTGSLALDPLDHFSRPGIAFFRRVTRALEADEDLAQDHFVHHANSWRRREELGEHTRVLAAALDQFGKSRT